MLKNPLTVLASVALGVYLSLPVTANATNSHGVDENTDTITLALSQEPRSLNPLNAESVSYTAQLMVHLQEGLMRYDGRRRLVGGVAERWQIDQKRIRFWLRDDAKWQNGEPVTAQDFVFAWQHLVQPDTASPSANLASPITNAAEIIKGNQPVASLGIQAIGEKELLVTLEHPCAWCLKLMTNSIFYPINRKLFAEQGDAYGTSLATHASNGPFKLSMWQRGKRIRLTRNEQYWGRDRIKLANINFDYINIDSKTAFNLFRSGEIATAELDRESISDALAVGYRIKTYPTGHLFHIQFSHRAGMFSANQNLRKAITAVIDKDELVNKVVSSPGTRIADSMFHDWLTIDNEKYISARPPIPSRVDTNSAKQYLAAAREELGITGPIKLSLTINDSSLYRRVAEYFQQRLKQTLDIEVAIDPQITQMMVEKWRKGSSDMTLITWPVDVDDPMDQISFMGNPDFRSVFQGLYAGDDMAALYYKNRDALGHQQRLNAVQMVQKLFTDRATVLPLFESYGATVISPRLKGFVWQPVRGYADFRNSRIVGQ